MTVHKNRPVILQYNNLSKKMTAIVFAMGVCENEVQTKKWSHYKSRLQSFCASGRVCLENVLSICCVSNNSLSTLLLYNKSLGQQEPNASVETYSVLNRCDYED